MIDIPTKFNTGLLFFTVFAACLCPPLAIGQNKAGLTIGWAHDSNPELAFDMLEYEESSLFSINPFLKMENIFLNNILKLHLNYVQDRFQGSPEINSRYQFDSAVDWLYSYSDTMTFFARSNLDWSSFGAQNDDVPEFMGKTASYAFRSGMKFVMDDWYELEVAGIWAHKRYRSDINLFNNEFVHGVNWQDWGISVSGSYILLPEMVFFSNMDYIFRNYSMNDISPGHQRVEATVGFTSSLKIGAEGTVQAHLFRYEFDGDVPRRMNPQYTNYGVSLKSAIPITDEWTLSIKAGSKYDLSERGVRKYFYNEYASAMVHYDGPFTFQADVAYSKLDYHAQEPLLKTHSTKANIMLGYDLFSWCRVKGFYRFFHRTQEEKDFEIDQQRLGLNLTFFVRQ